MDSKNELIKSLQQVINSKKSKLSEQDKKTLKVSLKKLKETHSKKGLINVLIDIGKVFGPTVAGVLIDHILK